MSGQESRWGGPWAHLLPWARQNYSYLQNTYQWQNQKTSRKDVIQLKISKRNHKKIGRKAKTWYGQVLGWATHKREDDYNCRGAQVAVLKVACCHWFSGENAGAPMERYEERQAPSWVTLVLRDIQTCCFCLSRNQLWKYCQNQRGTEVKVVMADFMQGYCSYGGETLYETGLPSKPRETRI